MSPLEKLRRDREKLAIVRIETRAAVACSRALLSLLKTEFAERQAQRDGLISADATRAALNVRWSVSTGALLRIRPNDAYSIRFDGDKRIEEELLGQIALQ